jgi:SAM-dependent methyltransferase
MFFDDPGAAFANISRALRPAGRLVMMVWQAHERNEWDVVIRRSLGAAEGPVAIPPGGPDPFSLAGPPAVKQILQAAGFAGVAFTDVHEPVYYGPDVAAALDWVRGFACTSEVLKRLDPAAAARAAGRLREALAAHLSDDGAWFNSRARIVTAHRHRDRTSPRSQLNDQPETARTARSQDKKRRHTVTSAGWCHRAWNRRVRGGLQLLHRIAKAAQNTLICAANVGGSRAL